MRFFIAAMLYLVSLAMIVVGVAQRTIWAPSPSSQFVVLLDGNTPYALIDHATLTKFPGEPAVRVEGGSPENVAISARESDIVAWLGNSAQTRVAFVGEGKKLSFSNQAGESFKTDPKSSDMWRKVITDPTKAAFTADTSNEAALLITSDGIHPSPNSISLIWKVNYDLTESNILIVGGLIVLFSGVLMNIIAYYGMRKRRGPRRRTPRAPQGPKYRPGRKNKTMAKNARGRRSARKVAAVTASVLVLSSLSACSGATPGATSSPSATVQADPPVLDESQIKTIVSDVVKVAAAGDEGKSSDALASRFDGPALVARAAHYKLQSRGRGIANLPPIANAVISFQLPAASREWPRIAMVVTASSNQSQLPQVLVLRQASARENYKVWYDISVLPGTSFPAVPTVDTGAITVAPDSRFLKVQPNQLNLAYGDVIDNGSLSEYASLFDLKNDIFYQQVSKSQSDTIAKLTKATVTVTHELGDEKVMALSTVNSGAIVAVYINDVYSIKPKKKSAVTVDGNEQLMFGSQGSARGIKTTYGDILLFYVPGASSTDLIQTLGATQFLLSVRGL